MSIAAIRRSFQVIHHLLSHGETRFTDLAQVLSPISRTGLSHLLSSLKEIGELEHDGRMYRLAASAASLASQGRAIYSLPPSLAAETRPIVERTAKALGHSCGLVARIGDSTMKVMDAYNLSNPHETFPPVDDETPLMPFDAFAQLFLSQAPDTLALKCYRYWQPYLQPNPSLRMAPSEESFLAELRKVRRLGRAIEYRTEVRPILRVAVPVPIPDHSEIRFAVGSTANFVYLLEVDSQVEILQAAAAELSAKLDGKLPANLFQPIQSTSSTPPSWTSDDSRRDCERGCFQSKTQWPPEESDRSRPEENRIAI